MPPSATQNLFWNHPFAVATCPASGVAGRLFALERFPHPPH
jgi:hypothetical protein